MLTLFCVLAGTRAPCPYVGMGFGVQSEFVVNVDANVVLRAYEDTGTVSLQPLHVGTRRPYSPHLMGLILPIFCLWNKDGIERDVYGL